MNASRGKMRFSLAGIAGLTWSQLLEAVTTAEELGFYGFYASDHLLTPGPGPTTITPSSLEHLDALTVVAALTAQTQTLRLGTMVVGNLFRHPVILAKVVSSIDHASGGRMELGLGANWRRAECDIYGFPFPPLKERLRRLEDTLHIITSLWGQERTTIQSEYHELSDAPFLPKPLQRPWPPIILGGANDETLRLAATYADEWNGLGPVSHVRERALKLDALRREQGQDPSGIRRSAVVPLHLTDDAEEVERRTKGIAAVTRKNTQRCSVELAAQPDEVVAGEAALVGGPEQVAAGVDRWRSAGINHLVFFTPRPWDRPMLERFASDVMPSFS